MSLPPRNTPKDYDRFMNQYLANLNQTIQNQSLVYNAVSANLSGDFADIPQMPQDMRSVEDKLRDIDTLKTQLRPLLMSLTDGATANEIVKELDDRPALLQVAIQSFPTLYQSLKPLWSMGVPAVVFIQAVANIQEKIDQTAGIDPAVNAYQSGLLEKIPYVIGLDTDKDIRQIQINKDIEASEIAAQEREADRLQGEANLEQALLDLEQLEQENAAIGLLKKARKDVKQRKKEYKEQIAQLKEAKQQLAKLLKSLQQGEQTEGFSFQYPIEIEEETKSGEATPRTKAKAVISQQAEAAIQAETERRKKEEEAKAFEKKKAKELLETERRLYGEEAKGSQSPGGISTISGITDTSMTTQPSASAPLQKQMSYLKTNFTQVLTGLMETRGDHYDGRSKSERRRNILTALQDGVRSKSDKKFEYNDNTGERISIADMVSGNLKSGKVGDAEKSKQEYWTQFNIEDMFNTYKAPAQTKTAGTSETKGSGLKPRRRTMSGRGVSFNIKEDEEAKPSPKKTIKLNIQGVIEKEPSYVPFGRYAINKHRLAGDILMLRTPKNGVVLKLPTQKISNKLSKIITTIANKGVPSFEAIGELDNNDKEILHKILQECHITNISTPNPSRDKSDDMYRRFVILRGEICSGNNNPALAKELKRLIIILMGKDLLPKREGTQALVELALLEM